jgi:hypothetical protein
MLTGDESDVEKRDTLWVLLARDPGGASLLSIVLESQVRRDQATFKPSYALLSESCIQGLLLRVEDVLLESPSRRCAVQIATV